MFDYFARGLTACRNLQCSTARLLCSTSSNCAGVGRLTDDTNTTSENEGSRQKRERGRMTRAKANYDYRMVQTVTRRRGARTRRPRSLTCSRDPVRNLHSRSWARRGYTCFSNNDALLGISLAYRLQGTLGPPTHRVSIRNNYWECSNVNYHRSLPTLLLHAHRSQRDASVTKRCPRRSQGKTTRTRGTYVRG